MAKSKKEKRSKKEKDEEVLSPQEELKRLLNKIEKIGDKVIAIKEKITNEASAVLPLEPGAVKNSSAERSPPVMVDAVQTIQGASSEDAESMQKGESSGQNPDIIVDESQEDSAVIQETPESSHMEVDPDQDWQDIVSTQLHFRALVQLSSFSRWSIRRTEKRFPRLMHCTCRPRAGVQEKVLYIYTHVTLIYVSTSVSKIGIDK